MGSQESVNDPIWIIIGFQQQDRQESHNFNNDTFCRLSVVSAQCIIGTEKYPDAGISLNYDDDDYAQDYSQINEAYRVLTKTTSFNHIYLKMISDLRMSRLMVLVVIYTFSIQDIRKILQFLNQLK